MSEDDFGASDEVKMEDGAGTEDEFAPSVGLLDDEVSDDPIEESDEFGETELAQIMYPNGESEYSY